MFIPMKMSPNLLLGEAGKHRVMSELLRRGINVYSPCVDDGIDLFTSTHRIQVKTANAGIDNIYRFCFKSWQRANGSSKQYSRLHPDVTHIVCWGVQDEAFWIFPVTVTGIPTSLSIRRPTTPIRDRTPNPSKFNHRLHLNAWHLFDAS